MTVAAAAFLRSTFFIICFVGDSGVTEFNHGHHVKLRGAVRSFAWSRAIHQSLPRLPPRSPLSAPPRKQQVANMLISNSVSFIFLSWQKFLLCAMCKAFRETEEWRHQFEIFQRVGVRQKEERRAESSTNHAPKFERL